MIILFFGDSVRIFFRLGLSMLFSELELSIKIASFERRLRGAAQTPLALPYPFRTWPGSGTWAERNKRKVHNFYFCFGRYTPELFLDLGIDMQSLNEKNIVWGEGAQ